MVKLEIFNKHLNAISVESGIPEEVILSESREINVVDARAILIYLLRENGLYPPEISVLLHKTSRSINQTLSSFHERLKQGKMIRILLERARKRAGSC